MREIASDRIVIKVGTSTLIKPTGEVNIKRIEQLTTTIATLKAQHKQVILVSSGAIGVGTNALKLEKRPTLIPDKQAVAAVGQSLLMGVYDKYFGMHQLAVGQMLITKDCIEHTRRYGNAINTLNALLNLDIIPIINENDTVAIDEIILGDNDTLSAYVATMINANLLIILSDIEGLYDKNPTEPEAKLITEVKCITEQIKAYAGGAGSIHGTGGMKTKVEAAMIAAKNGTKTIIMNGKTPEKLENVLKGEVIGTYFDLTTG
ncbi:MAG: glutamate 5-kinase [Defluviitaleaceae bacterium]|nr:glutamate 5-kinase [Defluviitaleaceae bacterium]